MAGGRTRFWNGIPRFALALACTTRQLSTSYRGKSGRQNSMPTKRPLARPGMPQFKTYTACSSSLQLVQRSPWFGSFREKYPAEGARHGQQAWAALREKFDVRSRAVIRTEHIRMTSTRMRLGQDPDDYFYHMDSCRNRLNACNPSEDPTDRQYKDIILQALPSEYDRVRQTHLERRDFGLANIRRMMATIYADNLSRSVSSKGIAGRGAAMQAVDRDCTSVLCHYCHQFGHFKRKYSLGIKHQQQQRQQPVRHHQQQ